MLVSILKKGDQDDEDPKVKVGASGLNKVSILKNKVKTMARMQKMFSTLRNESEMLLKIKNMAPDGKIPRGLLLEGRPAIRHGNPFIIFSTQGV
jgi:hypothetical protein